MSNELDKLAAEMRKLKSSKEARQNAMEAAMSAFNQEFSPETEAIAEKNIETPKGLSAEPRPTGQSIRESRVQTFGRQTMSKFNTLINFKPQTMMMAGTCAAALIAGLIVLPNMGDYPGMNTPAVVEAVPVEAAKVDEVFVEKDARAKAEEVIVTTSRGDTMTPSSQPSITSIDKLLDEIRENAAKSEAESDEREKAFQDSLKGMSEAERETVLQERDAAVREYRAVLQQKDNIELFVDQRDIFLEAEKAQANAESQRLEQSEAVPPAPEPLPAPPPVSAPAPQGGIGSFDRLLSPIRKNSSSIEAENRQNSAPASTSQAQVDAGVQYAPPPPPPVVEASPPPPALAPGGLGRAMSSVRNSGMSAPSRQQRNLSAPSGGTGAPAAALPQKIGGLTVEQSAPEFKTVTDTVVTQSASTELVTIPAEYETVTETLVVQEESRELVVIPGKYEWVEGDIEGSAIELKSKPAQYETVSETVVVQEASTELVTVPPVYETVQETVVVQPQYSRADGSFVPAVTKEVTRRVIKTPASTVERTVPAVTKTQTRRVVKTPASVVEKTVPLKKRFGKTRVQVSPPSTAERSIPAVTKQVLRRVVKTPARVTERVIPATPQSIERQVLLKPSLIYLRDDDGNVVREFESRDAFERYQANLPTPVAEKPVSTFSVDVDTASYSFLRASVTRGQLPPPESIRLEEMINYFPYDYEAPTSADEPFKANVTVTSNPWNADKKLMHVGIKGYVPPASERPNSNLVFLIDTSGSMRAQNKLPLLINSFKLLLKTLDEDDTVSIVTYAGSAGTVLEPTPANEKDKIKAALENLRSGGSTAGAAGLELAYNKAIESFDKDGVNRVILATDGDFNVGFSSPDEMKAFVENKRKSGVFLSVLGFGMGNYNDHLMQSLAQNGNGVAAYIDTLSEAQKVLANEAGSALFTIAKDVKIQVEFNPATIAEYRLIGYETRALKRQDFNNDKVDAGEIGAGHSVTAIYEMTPVGSPAVTMDKLRYVSDEPAPNTGSDEYAFVKIRHKLPDADTSTLQTFPISDRNETKLRRASDDMRFATAVAIVGQKLRGDFAVEDYSYEDAIKLAKNAKSKDEHGYRAEFIRMVKLIEAMEE